MSKLAAAYINWMYQDILATQQCNYKACRNSRIGPMQYL